MNLLRDCNLDAKKDQLRLHALSACKLSTNMSITRHVSKGSLNGGVICTVRIINLTQWLGFVFNHKLTMLAEFTKHPEPQNLHSTFKPNILYKPSLSKFCYLRNSYSCFTNLEKNSSKLYSESLKGGVERAEQAYHNHLFLERKKIYMIWRKTTVIVAEFPVIGF